ncbi:MAG TPA: nuclear transport factor 2 family protein [Acidimicrobiales bacterium]|nr:nuclear transport factor 2 family protein [Acidimicrobiales bacterium]
MDSEEILQRLMDRQAVEDVLYRYASTIDQKDYARLRSVFTDGAVAQYGEGPEMHGADTIVEWIREMCVTQGFQHHLINVYHVDFDADGDEARTLTYHTSHQIRTAEPDTDTLIVGRYRDVVRRTGDGWKIVDKRMEVGWIEERRYPQSAAADRERSQSRAAQDRSAASR